MQCGNDNRLLTQAFLEDNLSQDQNSDLTADTFDLSACPSEWGTHLVCLSSGSKAGGLSTEVGRRAIKINSCLLTRSALENYVAPARPHARRYLLSGFHLVG